jgi:hypothetical protein
VAFCDARLKPSPLPRSIFWECEEYRPHPTLALWFRAHVIGKTLCQHHHSNDHPVIGSDRICSVGLEIVCTRCRTRADTADVNTSYIWRHCKYSETWILYF